MCSHGPDTHEHDGIFHHKAVVKIKPVRGVVIIVLIDC